ncbi:MAG: 1-acyl-sn-glycerol-3-phosphate acyltransferase [Austwickia sp.]|jgi:1-acyl-sn-glycerol-3-phosphate acyltransferase|nr:MAG: 1-acyl-sn-glycerol-3-phosphate acyltransferase [Austwickia sp.]
MVYRVIKLILYPILTTLFRPRVEGLQHVPRKGAAILASNHLSFSDSIFLPLMLPRRLTFPAKMEYFTGTGIKGRLTAAFFRGVGQIPIDRSGGKASWAAMEAGLSILRQGELFGIYPEGTRSPDGRLHRGKTGMARLALLAGVPIIPVAMIDTDKAQPTGQVIPNITQIGIRIGAPMNYSRFAGQEEDHEVLRHITDEVMAALQQLSGQEYVDEYAADRKQAIAERAERMMAAARAQAEATAARARAEAAAATARAREEALSAAARARAQADEYAERAKAEYAAAVERANEATVRARAQATEATAKAFASAAEGAAAAEVWLKQVRDDNVARAEELTNRADAITARSTPEDAAATDESGATAEDGATDDVGEATEQAPGFRHPDPARGDQGAE